MYSALLNLLLVVPLIAAIPIPLEAEFLNHDETAHSGEKAQFDEALAVANTQITNMQSVLENPNDPRIAQAFGPNANLDTIRSTVDKLATKTLKVQTSDPSFADKEVAQIAKDNARLQGKDTSQMPDSRPVNGYVPVDKQGSDVQMEPARFGSSFYSGNDENDTKFRAGTIIHEATHQLARTGDHVGTAADDNKIIRAGLPTSANTRLNEGYAESAIPNTDAAMGTRYTDLREASPNMEHNADSYRVFASLCSRSLYKRALTQEDPVGYYLAKRQECRLPPDYFKKKAEAKAAAAAKADSANPESAQTPTKKGAVKAKTDAKGKGLKGTKTAKTGKAGKGVKASKAGKGVKSTRKSLKKGTKTARGGKAAKGTKSLKAAKGIKGAKSSKGVKGSKALKGTKATKGAKGLRAVKGPKAAKAAKGLKATKGTKATKAIKGAKSLKGAKTAKGLKSLKTTKGAKAVKTPKGTKATKGSKAVKGVKSAKASKSLKTSKGAKAGKAMKAVKGAKAVKGTKGVKTAKNTKGGKITKASKVVKGAKASKGVKTTTKSKATKGKVPASRAANKKTTTPRPSTKATGKAPRGGATKATKSTTSRPSQKVTKTAPKAALKPVKPAVKATAKVSTSKKAGKRN